MYPPNPVPFQRYPSQGPLPPPGPVAVVNPEKPPKKQGLLGGNLGNTVKFVFLLLASSVIHSFSQLVHSAVGGLGFGAGK